MKALYKDLKKVYIYALSLQDNGYVGQTAQYVSQRVINAIISPATSKLNIQAFGETAYKMIQITCDKKSRINVGDRLSVNSDKKPEYKVVSVENYTYHSVINAEAI